jgi:hypothetical protein
MIDDIKPPESGLSTRPEQNGRGRFAEGSIRLIIPHTALIIPLLNMYVDNIKMP